MNSHQQAELLAEALYWRVAYERSNPEVGMGPTLDMLLDEILKSTGIGILTPGVRAHVLALYKSKENH